MGHFEWSPNFYIVFVAKPGIATKSTSMDIGRELALRVQSIKFGPDVVTWQALPGLLQGASYHHILRDGSGFFPMSCLTLMSSELGNLLDPRDRAFVDFLVTMWDGKKTFDKVTKMSGNDSIINPWINLIAATTPDWLSDNLPKSLVGGGFVSRCIFVYGHKKRHRIAYPQREMERLNFQRQAYQDGLVHDLEEIAMLDGAFKLTDEAMDFGAGWYTKHCDAMETTDNEFGGYMARKQASMHKLAMVLSVSESSNMVIERHHLEQALMFLDALEKDYASVFQKIHSTAESERQDRLMTFLKTQPAGYAKRKLYQHFYRHFPSFHSYEEALNNLHQAGNILYVSNGTDIIVHLAPGRVFP
jgi:hypothetical protein